jgi:hypothetical protein
MNCLPPIHYPKATQRPKVPRNDTTNRVAGADLDDRGGGEGEQGVGQV